MPDRDQMSEQTLLDHERRSIWQAVRELALRMEEYDLNDFNIRQITIQSPEHTGRDWRAIIKGVTANQVASVAFVNADDLPGLLGAVRRGLANTGLKWREDKPWAPDVPKGV
jgi:t-SNARE complex subunit (syntaxin)